MPQPSARRNAIPEEFYRFDLHPGYRQLRIMNEGAARMGVRSPFFKMHEGTAGAETHIGGKPYRSEEHTSELQSLMRISYAVFCLKKKTNKETKKHRQND